MSASNREPSIRKTLTYEGGYSNDAHDPGGPTNHGITIIDARKYWKSNATAADVKAMPVSVAIDIYRSKYWNVMKCDDRPAGVDFVDFDLGVNSGPGRTTAFRAKLDPRKLAPVAYVKAQVAMRLSFLQGLTIWRNFGKGWARRCADVEATGVKMALAATGTPVKPALLKEAAKAKNAATKNTVGAVGTAGGPASQAPALPDITVADPSTKAGLIVLALALVSLFAYFTWNAYTHSQRSLAYTAAAKQA